MKYSEMRQFLLEANIEKLSPAEKDAFLYYDSRIRDQRFWDCPDSDVAQEIGRSRNSVCEGRNALKKRGWISEKVPFRIEITKTFPVENATDTDVSQSETRLERPVEAETSRECDSRVENATEPVENATVYKDKGIEVKEEVKEEPKPLSDAEVVFEFWKSHLSHPSAKFTKKRRENVRARLTIEKYSVEDLQNAIRGCGVSPHNQGANDRGDVYDDLELICRSGEKVERFLGIWERHVTGKSNGTNRNNDRAERAVDKHNLRNQLKSRVESRNLSGSGTADSH